MKRDRGNAGTVGEPASIVDSLYTCGKAIVSTSVGVDGLLHIDNLRDDEYTMEPGGRAWVGRVNKRRLGMGTRELAHVVAQFGQPFVDIAERTDVASAAPVIDVVAELFAALLQRRRGVPVGGEPGKDDDGVAVSGGQARAVHQLHGGVLEGRPHRLHAEQAPGRSPG